MRKFYIFGGLILTALVFANCHGSKKAMAATLAKPNYTTAVEGVITASCSPCHFPTRGGNKKPLDSYTAVSGNIDDIIHRIELTPADHGFMPFKHDRLPDSTIALIKQWKADGMPEK